MEMLELSDRLQLIITNNAKDSNGKSRQHERINEQKMGTLKKKDEKKILGIKNNVTEKCL